MSQGGNITRQGLRELHSGQAEHDTALRNVGIQQKQKDIGLQKDKYLQNVSNRALREMQTSNPFVEYVAPLLNFTGPLGIAANMAIQQYDMSQRTKDYDKHFARYEKDIGGDKRVKDVLSQFKKQRKKMLQGEFQGNLLQTLIAPIVSEAGSKASEYLSKFASEATSVAATEATETAAKKVAKEGGEKFVKKSIQDKIVESGLGDAGTKATLADRLKYKILKSGTKLDDQLLAHLTSSWENVEKLFTGPSGNFDLLSPFTNPEATALGAKTNTNKLLDYISGNVPGVEKDVARAAIDKYTPDFLMDIANNPMLLNALIKKMGDK